MVSMGADYVDVDVGMHKFAHNNQLFISERNIGLIINSEHILYDRVIMRHWGDPDFWAN